jgi:hypothetical protein
VSPTGGKEEATSIIFWFAHGWFWFHPAGRMAFTSVGAVVWPYYLEARATKPVR